MWTSKKLKVVDISTYSLYFFYFFLYFFYRTFYGAVIELQQLCIKWLDLVMNIAMQPREFYSILHH